MHSNQPRPHVWRCIARLFARSWSLLLQRLGRFERRRTLETLEDLSTKEKLHFSGQPYLLSSQNTQMKSCSSGRMHAENCAVELWQMWKECFHLSNFWEEVTTAVCAALTRWKPKKTTCYLCYFEFMDMLCSFYIDFLMFVWEQQYSFSEMNYFCP